VGYNIQYKRGTCVKHTERITLIRPAELKRLLGRPKRRWGNSNSYTS